MAFAGTQRLYPLPLVLLVARAWRRCRCHLVCESPQLLPNADTKPFIIWFRSESSQIRVLICATRMDQTQSIFIARVATVRLLEENPGWQHYRSVNSLISVRQLD